CARSRYYYGTAMDYW
nr:immunoglobulin heavy chain junction region [Mus musculus]MBK4196838.1 immunoglobulin heavy chain junction region [Mus musculus]